MKLIGSVGYLLLLVLVAGVLIGYLGRYVNEFAFRLNEGNVRTPTMTRLDALIAATAHKRITYAELIA